MMCQTDLPDDDGNAHEDPALTDTGFWPAIPDPEAPTGGASDSAQASASTTIDLPQSAVPPEPSPAEATPGAAPACDVGPRLMSAISQLNQLIEERVGALQTLFDREVRAEATRERIVDRLHAELQEYKHDLLLKVQRPIFIDLIQLHDDLGKMIDAQPAEDSSRTSALRGTLDKVRTAIEDILYRQGVEPFRGDGAEFDARRQRAVSTVETDETEKNKTIAARIRPGFVAGDKLIRPEIVSVFTLKR